MAETYIERMQRLIAQGKSPFPKEQPYRTPREILRDWTPDPKPLVVDGKVIPGTEFGGIRGVLEDFTGLGTLSDVSDAAKDYGQGKIGIKEAILASVPGVGIKAYHGSPHSFDEFKWDATTRGTGEGVQAYGDGLYFAENEGVARDYRDTLSPKKGSDAAQDVAKYWLDEAGGDPERAAQMALEYNPDATDVADILRNPSGHLYEVDINADPEHFLDWDKRLDEQAPHVDERLNQIVKSRDRMPSDWLGASPGAEQSMREAGIPGIKYLDAGSRGAGTGSRNYVIFDPKIINIVAKLGIAGALAAGLITEEMARQMREQGMSGPGDT